MRVEHCAILAISLLLLVRLLLFPVALLVPEEAYYWMYSQYPSLGYLDHPPMIAWLIMAGRYVFGDTEAAVRIGTWLLALGSTWLCYRLSADWCGRRGGIAGALLFSITPLFCGTGFVTTPDAPLIFFWLVALLAVTRAYRRGGQSWWVLAGLATGLGFVSKFPAMFLILGTFLFLLSDSRGRRMLLRSGPWLALLVAVIFALPVLWWNAQHDWASFRFQFARRVAAHGGFTPGRTLQWVGAQFALLSPLVFVLLTAAWWLALRRFRRDSRGPWRFAACFAIPWLAVCVWHGLFSKVHINWPLPAYLSLIPIAAVLLRARNLRMPRLFDWLRSGLLRRRYATAMVAVNVTVLIFVSVHIPLVPRPNFLAPWDDLGRAAEVAEDTLAVAAGVEPFIIADGRYDLASELAFYMRDTLSSDDWDDIVPAGTIMGGGLNFVNWRRTEDFVGRNAIFIATGLKPRKLAMLQAAFARVDEPRELLSHACGMGRKQGYWVINCWGLRRIGPELADRR
ncbi:MAG: glycosyltransferase family 39 protein [Planctomycetes bacterium]|nr:glycosyltransferase family 39 protein [Planctomycetota bacterium]